MSERKGFLGRMVNADGVSWVRTFRFGRVQVGWRAWRHDYMHSPSGSRWVVHPTFVYDAKPRRR